MIHKTAIIDPLAELDPEVEIGPYVVIEGRVTIDKGTSVGAYTFIEGPTTIGKNCTIYNHVSLGRKPQAPRYNAENTQLVIGDGNIFREFVTVHRGTREGGGRTVIGNNNFFMAYSHVAHDCRIGNGVVMANAANLGGHIAIEDCAIIGGLAAVHQFVRIGAYSMIGGASGVSKDVPPYTLAAGNHARLYGLNIVGLKRRGFSPETIAALKRAYRILFRSNHTLKDAIRIVEEEVGNSPEVVHFVEFIKGSERGICR